MPGPSLDSTSRAVHSLFPFHSQIREKFTAKEADTLQLAALVCPQDSLAGADLEDSFPSYDLQKRIFQEDESTTT